MMHSSKPTVNREFYATLGIEVVAWDADLTNLIGTVRQINDEGVPIAIWRDGRCPHLVAVVLGDGAVVTLGQMS